MKFKHLTAVTVLSFALNSCVAANHIKQTPLAEPPACTKIEKKCEQTCAPRAIFQKLRRLIEKSDIVLVGEVHSWVGHYGELAANMDELAKLGVKKIFIELPISYNKYISEYQQLRKEYLNPDITKKDSERIIRTIAELVKELTIEFSYFRDPAKFGYLIALLDRATISGITIVAVDTINDDSIHERDKYMSAQILSKLQKGEKALWLGGESHPEGMQVILSKYLNTSVFYVVFEILNGN
jgi:hypothetical protein